jgi:hypothetical protein
MLDGSSVPNPFDQMFPKSGEHLFVAKASGYLKKYSTIAFDQDKKLSLKLAPKKRKRRATRRTARKASRRASKPKKAASQTKSSRKGFISENPY